MAVSHAATTTLRTTNEEEIRALVQELRIPVATTKTRSNGKPTITVGAPAPQGQENTASGIVEVTPAIAANWLKSCGYEYQRKIKQWHIEELAQAMLLGEFTTATIIIAQVEDVRFLVNGQHTLSAIAKSGVTVELNVVLRRCADLDEVAKLYGTIDIQPNRTMREALSTYRLDEKTGIAEKWLNFTLSGIRFIDTDYDRVKLGDNSREKIEYGYAGRSREHMKSLMMNWLPEAKKWWEIYAKASKPLQTRMRIAPVLGIAFTTLRYQPEKAEKFWTAVAENDGLRVGTAEHTLMMLLLNPDHNRERSRLLARRIANCWNAYYKGRPIAKVGIKDPTLGVHIEGTPVIRKEGGW